jgi:cyclopropane-fatty-acyl-phospholipid synthase
MTQLSTFYENIRAHYDLSNEFYELFLDPTMTYSSAWFCREGMTLEEAQQAKIDLALTKADVQPGHRLLEIGFGWGYTARRSAEKFGANVLGLTLSQAQYDHVEAKLAAEPVKNGSVEIRIQGWEEFDEPVDRIVTLEVFEHFRRERYAAFFERCFHVLPRGGRMLLQTNLRYDWYTLEKRGLPVEHEHVLFAKFIGTHIFPGGELCEPGVLVEYAQGAGFEVPQMESLKDDYIPTLQQWAGKLEANRERAIELTSVEDYDNYMHYLTGCEKLFRSGHIDVMQFTIVKP